MYTQCGILSYFYHKKLKKIMTSLKGSVLKALLNLLTIYILRELKHENVESIRFSFVLRNMF